MKLCKVLLIVGLQAAFNIHNDNDAEVSLQIANAATQALLSYRMKMIPVLVCIRLLQSVSSGSSHRMRTELGFFGMGLLFTEVLYVPEVIASFSHYITLDLSICRGFFNAVLCCHFELPSVHHQLTICAMSISANLFISRFVFLAVT